MAKTAIESNYNLLKEKSSVLIKPRKDKKAIIRIGSATCENAAGSIRVLKEFKKFIKESNTQDICLLEVGCSGWCSKEPIVSVQLKNLDYVAVYHNVTQEIAKEIFLSIQNNNLTTKNRLDISNEYAQQKNINNFSLKKTFFDIYQNVPFFRTQTRIALRNAGVIDPTSIEDYIDNFGFSALDQVLSKGSSDWVIDEIMMSNLRGRGGGGFSTGQKWKFARNSKENEKYIICNADEGDPGAFMDRSMLESDPFSIIEGMMIAGYATGAAKGFFYIRAEYPLAVERTQNAIEICRKHGIFGSNIFGSDFCFYAEIRLGAGAFVCGEETALIASIEGRRGQPRPRPPFPAAKGLWCSPTTINNVETLANVPAIILIGGKTFADIGTQKSGGTKVFALAGNVNNTGLVEVPIGISLREIVYNIGGGIVGGKQLKAVQTGGPAGGFIPAEKLDAPIDYESLAAIGSIMGSGGMIVLDEESCMVDVAKFFLAFTQDESCGKCIPCREGAKRMLELLHKITSGNGSIKDIENLEKLSTFVKNASLCGLGKAAPNPVLSTLSNFKQEYLDHVCAKKCTSKKCMALVRYEIDSEKCIGCTLCVKQCPANCIIGERRSPHKIDNDKCVKCGNCMTVCRFNAIKIV